MNRDAHVKFMLAMLHGLPSSAQIHDPNRLTMAYFTISGLDLLNALQLLDVDSIMDWVYSAQVLPPSAPYKSSNGGCFIGFRGSPSVGTNFNPSGAPLLLHDGGHLPSTYSALSILNILGDDFSRLQKDALLSSIRTLQQPDGSFTSVHMGAETDLRFVYCAVVISAILNDWRGVDTEKAFKYIMDCQSYDDGFGLCPGLESHGGATYCAVAALLLMGYITFDPASRTFSSAVLDVNALVKWCVEYGGFSKWPGEVSDILHAYYGLCGMSLSGEPSLKKLRSEFGTSVDATSKIGVSPD